MVDHLSAARDTLLRFPGIASRMPAEFLDRYGRTSDLVDAHRVYAWLARGGAGWCGGQLEVLERLLESLPPSAAVDAKLSELWTADEKRVDSLATELLLARDLVALGHQVELEPHHGVKRPEMLVNKSILLEAKTVASRADVVRRLTYKICEDVPSGRAFAFEVGEGLCQDHVAPLVRKVRRWVEQDHPPAGAMRPLEHNGVRMTIEVRGVHEDVPATGSCVVDSPPLPTPAETMSEFSDWLTSVIKKARRQTTGFAGRRLLVADVSHMRSAVDSLSLYPGLVSSVANRCNAGSMEILVGHRLTNFGDLVFEPPNALRDAFRVPA